MNLKRLLFLFMLVLAACHNCVAKRTIKISALPDVAKIYVDGNYVGDGNVVATMTGDFIAIKIECEGYVTLNTKIYKSDKRKAVSYTLRPDPIAAETVESGLVNRYFTLDVSESLYTVKDGKIESSKAWKLIHQIVLNYFDEIESTDVASGFIQTPWKYKRFASAEKMMRSRVSFRDISTDENFVMQVKITSEVAPLLGADREQSYQTTKRLLKELEPLIGELQSRVAKPK